uniref:Cytochrome P450 n=1 Tax=Glossina austeni TaxID=7395 RepID=A0A1A9UUN8_GLOAU
MSMDILNDTVQENVANQSFASSSIFNSLLTASFGLVLILALYDYWRRNTRSYRLLKNMPTVQEYPVVGHGHIVLLRNNPEVLDIFVDLMREVGDTLRLSLGHINVVAISNPVDVEIFLSGQKHLEKSVEYRFFHPWFGDGLLVSKGHHWRHHRKMIAPTFHQSILKSFVPTFVQHSKAVCDRLLAKVGKDFDCHKYMSETTVNILLTTAMGVKTQPEMETSAEYSQAVMDMCDIIHNRQVKMMYRMDALYRWTNMRQKDNKLMNIILSMTQKVVEERKSNFNADERAVIDKVAAASGKKTIKEKKEGLRDDLDEIDENDVGEKKRLALLDAMMEMEKNPNITWTDKDIRDEVNTIMFEGHDTTAAGSSFTLCMLGIHQDIQQRVVEEQEAIFGHDMQRDCTFADTVLMNYLERVICETVRLFPPVPLIARKAEEDVKLASAPYIVPKGTAVLISQFIIHRRASVYPDPDKFDPDRFLPERTAQRHYYSFIPFSAGPRSCVGRKFAMLQLKVLLSTIIRKYKVFSSRTDKDFRLQGDIILKLANGFQISLEPRAYAETLNSIYLLDILGILLNINWTRLESIMLISSAIEKTVLAIVPNSWFTLFVGLVTIGALYEYWRRNTREYKLMKNIPTIWEMPIVGHGHLGIGLNTVEIGLNIIAALAKLGETARGNLFHIIAVVITNPKDIELFLNSHKHLEKSVEYRYFRPWFGDGLLISKGQHWRHHRKMIAPTFHQSILKSFVPTFVKHSKAVCNRLNATIGQEFDAHKYMSETTVDVLLTTVMGIKTEPETEKSAEYAQAVMDMCQIIHNRQYRPLYRLNATYKWTEMRQKGEKLLNIILNMTREVVKERKVNFNADERAIKEKSDDPLLSSRKISTAKKTGLRDDLDDIDENDVGEKKRLALLDSMLEMENDPNVEWTDKDINDEVNTIMFEGHDTVAAGSSFVLCLLGIHQDVQKKVYAEQKKIFGNDMLRDCTFSDTLHMNYLERVICETFRLYPPVPAIARRVEEDTKLISGPYTIAKGTTVIIPQYFTHRRPDIYPEPNKFDPDRFLPECAIKRHYYSFIPFSAGPRSCVGRKYAMLQLKVLLSTMTRRFQIISSRTEEDFLLQADIILKLANGFNISLEPRGVII